MDGARTPFIKARGRPGPFTPVDLAVQAGRPLLLRQPIPPNAFDDVILGCVNVHPDEVNPGRVAVLRLGLDTGTSGWTVQRNCASGMQSIDSAFRAIQGGHADLILAGGTEALSHSPILFRPIMVDWLADWNSAKTLGAKAKLVARLRPGHFSPSFGLLRGLTDPVVELNMGQTAEVLAHQFGISRLAADEYAVESHKRLAAAHANGHLEELEIMIARDGRAYDHDDGVRPDNSVEQLAKLRPAFEPPFGKVTAGNSSQITDGASWVIVASEKAIKKYGLKVLGRIIDSQWASLDPKIMGLGPVLSSTAMMVRNDLDMTDIDYWEINEAFGAQILSCLAAWRDEDFCKSILGLDGAFGAPSQDRLNVDGGAISLGHPVGTSGTRIVLHLLHVLRRNDAKRGVATACIGGGMGGSMLLETA